MLRQLLSHTKLQILTGLRDPAYFFSTILLPAGVFWFFGVPEAKSDYIAVFLCCSFSAFSFFGVFFFQYSISTAQEKNSDWLFYLKTLPVKPHIVLIARFITSTLLGILSCLLIYIITITMTPSQMTILTLLKLIGTLTLFSFPFLLMGLFLGNIFSAKAMVPVANFFHLVLSFAGGLWKPPEILPETIQKISPLLPTYHYGMLVWPLANPKEMFVQWENINYMVLFSLGMLFLLYLQKKYGKN